MKQLIAIAMLVGALFAAHPAGAQHALRLAADTRTLETLATWTGDLSDGASLEIQEPARRDMTRGGTIDAFNLSLNYRPTDTGPVITVWSGSTDASIWEWTPYTLPSGLGYVIPFLDFVPLSGHGADFTAITRIEFEPGAIEADMLKKLEVHLKADATLTASKIVQIEDLNLDGAANPGERLQYFIQIQNQGTGNATNVLLTDIPDAKSTLVSGSVSATSGTVTSGNQPGASAVTVSIPLVGVAPCQPQLVTVALTVVIDVPFFDPGDLVCNQATLFSPDSPVATTDNPFTIPFNDPTCVTVTLGPEQAHSVDTDGDGIVRFSELLRVIQFYNSTGYGCEPGTEDNYAPQDPDQNCPPHDADYKPQDWAITLSELLRIVQFYNLNGYYYCPDNDPVTEDLFCGIV
jgi:uncharacterized repeat protein (TIGR01451 family)